jgi:hypothetical protein
MAIDRLKRLIEALRILINEEFSGFIRINFTQGSIGRIEKFEEMDETAVVFPAKESANQSNTYWKEGHKK